MADLDLPQVTSAALKKLRNEASLTRPADGTLQKVAYRYGLVKRDIAVSIIDLLNYHLKARKLQAVNSNAIVEFDCYIEKFGIAMTQLESRPSGPDEDPLSAVASTAGVPLDVVTALKKSRLVPMSVAEAVCNATQTLIGFKFGLKVTRVSLVDFTYLPVPVGEGRASIFELLASRQI